MLVIKSLELDLINNFNKIVQYETCHFHNQIFSLQFGIQVGNLVYSMNHVTEFKVSFMNMQTYYIKCLNIFILLNRISCCCCSLNDGNLWSECMVAYRFYVIL